MTDPQQKVSNRSCELVSLYALDALTPAEKAAFEEHLRRGCASCIAELAPLRAIVGQLGLVAAAVHPPEQLRQRLLECIAEAPQRQPTDRPGVLLDRAGLLISRSVDMGWREAGVPGLQSKPLFVDEARGYMTALVRMAPGTRYPSHRHTEVEELYLLEGDLLVEGLVMRPGDYCRAEPDTIHSEVSTEAGALFLVCFSQHDKLLV